MEKLKAIIEQAADGGYAVRCEEIAGAYGYGMNEDEAKADFLEVVAEQCEYYQEKTGRDPEWMGAEFEYVYDLRAFFALFPFINVSSFAHEVGVNSSLMRQYSKGLAFASERQRANIEQGLRRIVSRLSAVRL